MENLEKAIVYFSKFLSSSEFKLNESLKLHTSFKIGGRAKIFIMPKTKKHLKKCFKFILKNNIKFAFLGAGTNTLARDEDFEGVVINFNNFKGLKVKKNKIYAESGVSLFKLNEFAMENSLSGLEKTYGIPGSVGGGIVQNCGAYGYGISENLDYIIVLDNGKFKKIKSEKIAFAYRDSVFKNNKNLMVVGACFKLLSKNKEEISNELNSIITKRKKNQPYDMPSAGSVFKRCENVIVSKLLDEMGLKGYSVGGAQVSTKHAGFIVNFNNAKAIDVLNLITYIKNKVKLEKNINLEEEIVVLK